jgi:hypothetical protein
MDDCRPYPCYYCNGPICRYDYAGCSKFPKCAFCHCESIGTYGMSRKIIDEELKLQSDWREQQHLQEELELKRLYEIKRVEMNKTFTMILRLYPDFIRQLKLITNYMKMSNGPGKWVCSFCGQIHFDKRLDHFEKKHSKYMCPQYVDLINEIPIKNDISYPTYEWDSKAIIPLFNFKILLYTTIVSSPTSFDKITDFFSSISDIFQTLCEYTRSSDVCKIVLEYEGQMLWDLFPKNMKDSCFGYRYLESRE